jgi:large subunit ribosomal protein L22
MEVRAIAKTVRIGPKKVRVVAKELKGKHAILALEELRFHPTKAARILRKVLRSAVSNAVENHGLDEEELVISRVQVDEGLRLKRVRPRAMGRVFRILKPTSHITVVLTPGEPFRLKRSQKKPKPRPVWKAQGEKVSPKEEAPQEAPAEPEVPSPEVKGEESSAEGGEE